MAKNTEIKTAETRLATVRSTLIASRTQILGALPNHLDPTRMFRVYLTAAQTTPRIADCDPTSLVGAVMQAAQFGLSLDTVMGEAYLIPRFNKNVGGLVVHFQIGYKGLRKLAKLGDADVRDIYAYPVFENDFFEYEYGLDPKLTHKPVRKGRGTVQAAYAVAVWKRGSDETADYKRFEVVEPDDIQRAIAASDSAKKGSSSPWNTHPEAMHRKTALLRLCGQLPLASDSPLLQAIGAEEVDGRTLMNSMSGNIMPGVPVTTEGEDAKKKDDAGALDRAVAQGALPGATPNEAASGDAPAEEPTPRRTRRGKNTSATAGK